MRAKDPTRAASRRAGFARAAGALFLALAAGGATAQAEAPSTTPPETGSTIGLDTAFFKSDEPIEITADRLDVDQTKKRAVFGGNVNAVQGNVHLAAQVLTVFYDDASDSAAAVAAGTPASAAANAQPSSDVAGAGGRIKRMEVTGGVHVSSPTEIATGDKGIYDMEGGTITLVGNVIVMRGENVLRGSRLSIDVASGKSNLEGSEQNGRVKGLFVPKSQTVNKQENAPSTTGTP